MARMRVPRIRVARLTSSTVRPACSRASVRRGPTDIALLLQRDFTCWRWGRAESTGRHDVSTNGPIQVHPTGLVPPEGEQDALELLRADEYVARLGTLARP